MVEITTLNETNVRAVAEIEKECFSGEAWSENLFFEELTDSNKTYFVANNNGKVVGFGGYAQILDEGHIMNIAVSKEYRKQGIATALLNNLIETGKKNGINAFTLEVRIGNLVARKVYERTGFKLVGIRPKYYPDKEDACIYWLYI